MHISPRLLTLPPTVFETFPRKAAAYPLRLSLSSTPSASAKLKAITSSSPTASSTSFRSQSRTSDLNSNPFDPSSSPSALFLATKPQRRIMASSTSASLPHPTDTSLSSWGVESGDLVQALSSDLDANKTLLTGSVLDLFAAKPSKLKLALWNDDATFIDPLAVAQGRKKFEAQWYGLAKLFSKVEIQPLGLVSAGNPIEFKSRNKYTVAGIGSEQTIESHILIHLDETGQRISKVEDKWDNSLPEGPVATAMRKLNGVVTGNLVSVPNSIEEEQAKSK